jgi:hypothetical protein
MSKRSSNGFKTLIRSTTSQCGAPSEGDRIAELAERKMIRQGLITSQDQPATPRPETPPPQPPAPTAQATITAESVQQMVQAGVEAATQALDARLSAEYASRQAAIETTQQEQVNAIQQQLADAQAALVTAQAAAAQSETQRTALVQQFGLNQFQGNPEPVHQSSNFGVPSLIRNDRPTGAALELSNLIDRAPKVQKLSQRAGGHIVVTETREIDRFVRQNREQVIQGMQAWGEGLGLFQGGRVTQAVTVAADIVGGFLPSLSALMRENNRSNFIFHQFANIEFNFAKQNGDAIKIPRAPYLPSITDPNDRLLSGGGTFANIDSGNNSIQTGTVDAVVQEWGLGKNALNAPISISNFIESYSMVGLMSLLERNLMQDYYSWEDLKIRSLWRPTSRVVYNDKGGVTPTVADLAAGDDGTITETFLNNLYAYMRASLIPTYMDGCYGLVLNTFAMAQFKNSLGDDFHPATPQELENLTNIMNSATAGEMDRVTGYVGRYCNFMIFETNAFACGAAGTEGVRNETIDGSPRVTRSNYAFGSSTIGRGIGSPVEIRRDNNDGFGRLNRFIWLEESGFVAMDVDPTGYLDSSAVPQQLRVIEVRSLAVPL